MRWLEVEYRLTPEGTDLEDLGWRRLKKVPNDAVDIRIPDLDVDASYDVRVRQVDDDGSTGEWFTWTPTLVDRPEGTPPAPASVRMTCSECIVWDMPTDVRDLAGFKVRHSTEDDTNWGRAEPAHDGLVSAPPFPLCAVPRGRRELLVVAVDHDGNESTTPAAVVVDRGELNDADEFTIREVDYAASLWPGDFQGGTIFGPDLVPSASSGAPPDAPMWLSDLEPAWSVAEGTPAWTDPDAPAWGRLFGGAAAAWRGSPAETRWVAPYRWLEYVFSIDVDSIEAGPETVLSLDVETTAKWFRLAYRRRYPARAWTGNPKAPYWTLPSNPAWDDSAVAFKPWPGRLVGVNAGEYQFRLLCAAQFTSYAVTGCKARLSEPRREIYLPAQTIPLTTTRTPADTPLRELLEVRATRVGADAVVVGPAIHQLHRRKGPIVGAVITASGTPLDSTLDVVLIGHGSIE